MEAVRLCRNGLLAAAVLGGCGLVSSDIASIAFDLPAKHYVFDTASWALPPQPLPPIPCTTAAECGPPELGDSIACDASVCGVTVGVQTSQAIDLGNEVPELRSLSGQSLADVTIRRIEYSVASTLNVPLPPVELFLAPEGVTSAGGSPAEKFGTLPAVAARATVMGDVALEPGAQALFARYAKNFATPFNFIARSVVLVRGGEPLPSGTVDVTVRGKLVAKPSL